MVKNTCKLCLNEFNENIKNHVIPKFIIKELKGKSKGEKFTKFNVTKKRKTNVPDEFYEVGILCSKCENKISKFENYLREILFEKIDPLSNGGEESNLKVLQKVDTEKYKIGLLSILWRSSVTSHPFFKSVDLGVKHSEVIREILLEENLSNKTSYIVITSFTNNLNEHSGILPIQKSKIDFYTMYRFFLNRWIFYFCLGKDLMDKRTDFLKFSPNEGDEILIIKHKKGYMSKSLLSGILNDKKLRPTIS